MFQLVPHAYAMDSVKFGKVLDPIISNIVTPLVTLVFAIAFVVFAYGILQIVINAEDGEARTKGKTAMITGIVGMTIMLSAWGIIYIISNTIKGF